VVIEVSEESLMPIIRVDGSSRFLRRLHLVTTQNEKAKGKTIPVHLKLSTMA
jgi:hypothetical protein